MQLGVSLEPSQWANHDGDLVLHTAQRAERLGFHYVLMSGHVLDNHNGSAMDPLVLLSAVAGATSRIRVATSVLVAPYYNPVVLANQAATLDVVSNGRFVLGVGTGWNPDEFEALGVPLRERGARTDEYLEVMKALWSGAATDYTGRFTSLRQAVGGVLPRTAGGPPVWVGGHSDAALRRALRFADGWHGGGIDHHAAAEVRARLATLGEQIGRDPATLRLTAVCFLTPPGFHQNRPAPGRLLGGPKPTAASVLEEIGLLNEAGISMCSLWMPVAGPQLADALDWIAQEITPAMPAMP
jgi:probable F420-dependent oxidoreductase